MRSASSSSRSRSARFVAFFAALLLVLLAAAPRAHAQMSESDRKASARAAYMEGIALQDANKPAEALARFEAAQKLYDAPTHLLHIAECQALLGKLVEASETYEVLARKPLGSNPPEAFVAAQKTGQEELPAVRAKIPTLRVTVRPEASQLPNLQVLVNGTQMPNELLGIARPVNPGSYKLTAAATGWATPGPTEIDLKEKDTRAVELTLVRSATAAPVVAPVPVPPPYVGPTQPGAPTTPAPADQTAPVAPKKTGPSDFGFLLGMRAGVFVPGGNVTSAEKFEDFARTGGGIGFDVMMRFAKALLLGLSYEYASLGAPDRAVNQYSASSTYFGALLGVVSNVDKVSFIGDVFLGRRGLSAEQVLQGSRVESSVSGLELGLGGGVNIPAGPIRIVPKLSLSFGQFSSGEVCGRSTATSSTCVALGDRFEPALHTMIFAGLGIYYHVDLGKK